MKKLKSNQGITLPFTVVVMFFVALLIAALVGYVSLSYQLSTRQIRLAEHKIILENEMYNYINEMYDYIYDYINEMYDYFKNIDDIGDLNSFPSEADFTPINENYYIKVFKNKVNLIKENLIKVNLIIELKEKEQINYPNVVLKAELEFTLTLDENNRISYQIKKGSGENKLIIELKDNSNYINIVLKAELEYSYSGTKIIYKKITKWGF